MTDTVITISNALLIFAALWRIGDVLKDLVHVLTEEKKSARAVEGNTWK